MPRFRAAPVTGLGAIVVVLGSLLACKTPPMPPPPPTVASLIAADKAPLVVRDDEGAARPARHAGCVPLAELNEKGKGIAADPARAEMLYVAACGYGDGRGCTRLAAITAKKPKVDRALVGAYYGRACQLDDVDGCLKAARLSEASTNARTDRDRRRAPAGVRARLRGRVLAVGREDGRAIEASSPVPDIDRVMHGLRPRLRACSQRGLAENPTIMASWWSG
jgi:hypothetical protein